ncbi:MAG: DUF1566 domain-containing protein [Anaerolineaceae bacterium]|nr:DUF1566 domain-containing protein [Anaerolineaceae bacterium]
MFKTKKLFYLFMVITIGLTACGTSPVETSIVDQPELVQPVGSSVQENVQEAETTVGFQNTQPEQTKPAELAVLEKEQQNTQTTTSLTYPIVDTDQGNCFDAQNQVDCPQMGSAFFGQDSQYTGKQPSYTNNGDGTILDNVSGLMWQQDPGEKMTYSQAVAGASDLDLVGYSDWRLPSIKELYSLIQFDGLDPSGSSSTNPIPFIDTDYFNFEYGDESAGERVIDSQWATSTKYVSTTMNGNETMFGVNFADGRIKGYPIQIGSGGKSKTFFVIYVRGNTAYGENSFVDNADDTISDNATGLTWTQNDSTSGMNWKAALYYCESLDTGGIADWRLPNVKELQSIVDYTRSPDTTNSAAIDPIFSTSTITNEAGQIDYPFFWSSTTHENQHNGAYASYVSFGRAMGYMKSNWIDVHGAGAQRSDPKTGSAADWPTGQGPQGDARRVDNYVRCVTDNNALKDENPISNSEAVMKDNLVVPSQDLGEPSYLFSPLNSTITYLIDTAGNTLHTWESNYTPGNSVYLLENGNLLRTGSVKSSKFNFGGSGGIIEEIALDSTVLWSYQYADDQVQQHHDIEQMPNGNILMIAWEIKTEAEAIAAGRDPNLLSEGQLLPDHIVELDPDSNNIVWEWHIWDHLIQDFDISKDNYGVLSEHPELIDINFTTRLAAADWNHINSIDYNAELDQILVSVHNFNEIWIIDHNTSKEEAAGAAGDLLYRWGNPQVYDSGSANDQQFYLQHDAQWIPDEYPGAGNILVFNNGDQRSHPYSSIEEIVPPLNADGSYMLASSSYGPETPTWTYTSDNPSDFFADRISGAQRLSNGNTLICDGTEGFFFEVTPAGEIIWRYDSGSQVFRVIRYEDDYAGLPEKTSEIFSPIPTNSAGNSDTEADPNNKQQGNRPRLDLETAAATLGVTEEALRSALGAPPPDLTAAAAALGVTEEALISALGIPAQP